MGEHPNLKGTVVVPLRAHADDADSAVVAQAEDVSVWRLRVDSMGAMNLSTTPELAGSHLFISG